MTPNAIGKEEDSAAEVKSNSKPVKSKKSEQPSQHVPFISHCAPVNVSQRLQEHGPERLTIKEIRSIIEERVGNNALPSKSANKATHVEALRNLLQKESVQSTTTSSTSQHLPPPSISAEDAAREKASSGESRAVEHIAELSREQAIRAIAVTPSPAVMRKKRKGRRGGVEKDGDQEFVKRKSPRRKILHNDDDDK